MTWMTSPASGRLSDTMSSHGDRDNHFNLLRILLAAGVLLGHCFQLTGGHGAYAGEPWHAFTGGARLLGTTCVLGFFVISGYLVSQSFARSSTLTAYFRARILRIYPAAIVCALLTGLVLGPLVTNLAPSDYFQSPAVHRFLVQTTTFFSLKHGGRSIDGAFASNPIPENMNGSLWTISWELLCYVVLVPFGWLLYRERGRFGRASAYVLLVVLAIVGSAQYALRLLPNNLIAGFLAFWAFFAIGILGHAVLPRLPSRPILTALALVLFLVLARVEQYARELAIVTPFLFGYLLLTAATQLPRSWLRYNRLGDFSYGLYLYAWPVQQTLVHAFPGIGPWTLFAGATVIAVALGVLSWKLIERPALRFKQRASAKPTLEAALPGAAHSA
jgi:peptidoglycan/LPS O-acetylase OafA/YrhL